MRALDQGKLTGLRRFSSGIVQCWVKSWDGYPSIDILEVGKVTPDTSQGQTLGNELI